MKKLLQRGFSATMNPLGEERRKGVAFSYDQVFKSVYFLHYIGVVPAFRTVNNHLIIFEIKGQDDGTDNSMKNCAIPPFVSFPCGIKLC